MGSGRRWARAGSFGGRGNRLRRSWGALSHRAWAGCGCATPIAVSAGECMSEESLAVPPSGQAGGACEGDATGARRRADSREDQGLVWPAV